LLRQNQFKAYLKRIVSSGTLLIIHYHPRCTMLRSTPLASTVSILHFEYQKGSSRCLSVLYVLTTYLASTLQYRIRSVSCSISTNWILLQRKLTQLIRFTILEENSRAITQMSKAS